MYIQKWLDHTTSRLEGKLIAVTGTTGGLGQELCRYLAQLGASLILLDRNPDKSERLRRELTETYRADVRCLQVDLEDVAAVATVTEQLKSLPLDAFIHNAGAYSIPRRICATGYDNVFQINFASPYYMIRELLPDLRTRRGRVVIVGSIAHRYSKTDPNDIDFASRKQASKVYGNAKRYLMFALYELFKDDHSVTLSVTHPGITFTNITAHYPPWLFAVIKHPMKVIFMKPKTACLSILRGVYESCDDCEWIGPRWFDVWGLPQKRVIRTVSEAERRRIGETGETVYQQLRSTL